MENVFYSWICGLLNIQYLLVLLTKHWLSFLRHLTVLLPYIIFDIIKKKIVNTL